MNPGDRAPDFKLPSMQDREVGLSDFAGKKNVVLFFYTKDGSGGCKAEASKFRDAYKEFVAADAEVIGISSDSIESHRTFARRFHLPMQLLSDRGGKVRKLYGVKRILGLFAARETFVIDKQGIVRHVLRSQFNTTKHVKGSLAAIRGIAI